MDTNKHESKTLTRAHALALILICALASIAANVGFESLRLNLGTGIAKIANDAGKFGQLQTGSIAFQTLANPGAPTVTNVGTTGAATWTYKIVAKQLDGSNTAAGAAGSTTTGNATLTTSNYNHLAWTAVTGAASYDIYRTAHGTTPSTNGKLATVTAPIVTYDDKAAAGNGASAPIINSTGTMPDATGEISIDATRRQLLVRIPASNPPLYYAMVDWSDPQLGIRTNGVFTVVPGFPNRGVYMLDDHITGLNVTGDVDWNIGPDSMAPKAISGYEGSADPSVRLDVINRILKTPGGTNALDFSDDTQTVFGTTIKPVHLDDGDAPDDSIYYSTTSSKLVYKDPGGTVRGLY
jgi:hypothetical protein